MTAGFERDIECGALGMGTGAFDRQNFCMRKTGAEMKTLPYDSALLDDDGAHHGIRTGRPSAFRSQAKG